MVAQASAWCAQYDLHSGGESPLWTVMTGTIRLGKGVRREAGSEESRRRNRGFDVQPADLRPAQRWATRPGTGTPDSHGERSRVNPTSPREGGKPYLRRSRLWSAHTGLPREQSSGTGVEKSAEAVVARPGEGLNLPMQGAGGPARGTRSSRRGTPPGWRARAQPASPPPDSSKRSRHGTSNEP
jgi:hypothetical protein